MDEQGNLPFCRNLEKFYGWGKFISPPAPPPSPLKELTPSYNNTKECVWKNGWHTK